MKKKYLLVIFLILNYADAIITMYAINTNLFVEQNPFYYINRTLFWIVKIIVFPIFLVTVFRKLRPIGFYLIIGLYTCILASNFYIMLI